MSECDEEQWRPIPGCEDRYLVSDRGRVRSLPRPRTTGGLLSLRKTRHGYPRVTLLQHSSRRTTRLVHQLVAEVFIGPRPVGMDIRHLNGDPSDARLVNLAYGTRGENMRDKRAHGTDHQVAKTHCPFGHVYDEVNTYTPPGRVSRQCRACIRLRSAAYQARKKAAA